MARGFWTKSTYTILLVAIFFAYFLVNRNLPAKIDLSTYADKLIPFSAPFSILYLSYLGLLWGSVSYALYAMSLEKYKRFVASLVVVQITAYIAYILIPGYINRPALQDHGFFLDLVRTIYMIDMPSTLTPSLHVANSWLIALTLSKKLAVRSLMLLWASLIILSTLFIKQHYLIDVGSGLFLSTFVYVMFEKYWRVNESAPNQSV